MNVAEYSSLVSLDYPPYNSVEITASKVQPCPSRVPLRSPWSALGSPRRGRRDGHPWLPVGPLSSKTEDLRPRPLHPGSPHKSPWNILGSPRRGRLYGHPWLPARGPQPAIPGTQGARERYPPFSPGDGSRLLYLRLCLYFVFISQKKRS